MARKKFEMPKLKKISVRTLESIRKETSRYIYVYDKDGHAKCERCNGEFILPKTRHLQKEVKCPNCKEKMQIIHDWRRTRGYDDRVDWRVVASVIDDAKIILRYVLVYRIDDEVRQLEEVSREICDFENQKVSRYERKFVDGKITWKQGTWNFFRETNMGWGYRRFCCLQADIHNIKNFINELKKSSLFKYVELTDILTCDRFYISSLVRRVGNRSLEYEQLQKAGFSQLVMADIRDRKYDSQEVKYYPGEKSLAKKIGLTDRTFKLLKTQQNLQTYNMLFKYPDMTDKEFELFKSANWGVYEAVQYHANHLKLKQARYVVANKINLLEYIHYFRICEELNYPKTDYYLYPKNFRQMDEIVADEYLAYQDKIKAEQKAKHSKLIHKISEGLRSLPEIKELMGGSNGLLVYVPDSADDLIEEGKALNNCIGTYVERIAKQKTLIFYIRQLQNPTAPFVAMEVSYDGRIHQVRYNHNKVVEDNNIIDFAKKVAEIVKRNKDKLIKAA